MDQRFFKTENPVQTAMEQSMQKASAEIRKGINKQMDAMRIKLQKEGMTPNIIKKIIDAAAQETYNSCMAEFKEKFSQKVQVIKQGNGNAPHKPHGL